MTWQIHDAFAPNLDTGSIRAAANTPIQGFGNIFVQVSTTNPEPRMNGQMMRDFGLTYNGADTFETTKSVNLGNVWITRDVYIAGSSNHVRFFDTFTNTTTQPITVDVSFGGSLGYNNGAYQSSVRDTSSGDTTITPEDSWVLIANQRTQDRPIGVVLGTPGPFAGAMTGTGNQQQGPFDTPLPTSGNDANFYGFINQLTIEPGHTQSLIRYVYAGEIGPDGLTSTAASLEEIAKTPDLTNLTPAEVCTVSNWDLNALDDALEDFNAADCAGVTRLDIPNAPAPAALFTTSSYDVFDKTIEQLQNDMENGITTSEAITRAYLDRIAAYDQGQLGLHSFLHVSSTAIEQARAADAERRTGRTGELLGIPIAIKDIFDTKDMPTTGGSKALAGWQPQSDAYQVEKLREAGAVIIGKTNTSEFANSGSFSESGWMQTWNALYPSKTSFGSSGGSGTSVAASFASAALGSQTGVSLYAPTTGASLTTFRGTDGMASTNGVMPLTWGQDYAGPIARTVTDLAYLLNATTGTDPGDIWTVDADTKRPEDWTAALDANALQGKRIGYIPAAFVSSFADDGTGQAVMDRFQDLVSAGAEMVEMTAPDTSTLGTNPGGGKQGAEGWARYISLHNNFPYATGDHLLASDDVLVYNKRNLNIRTRMTDTEVEGYIAYRTRYKEIIADWMTAANVDILVYPGFISDMYNNDAASASLSSDRASGVLTSNVGLPTVVVPVGTSPNGYSISMQLVGKAWDDANVLAMGYALEQQTDARTVTTYVPALRYQGPSTPPVYPDPTLPPVTEEQEQEQENQEQQQGSQQEQEGTEEPLPEVESFPDTLQHWAKADIDFLIQKGLLSGYPDGTFRPNVGISRAEAVKVLAVQLELGASPSTFTDVSATHWASNYIGAAALSGVLNGYTDGTFRPDMQLTRAEMAALIVRAFQLSGGSGSSTFSDVSSTSWALEYIEALTANQITNGYEDGSYRPDRMITRAEFATMIARILKM
ncbi:amidase family protein [Paenibacillus daejeonensis]|uniref:amidase family protein n=1 Tax=Paenibacillus daejeonensis TaxID=135193 RepID=UPI000382D2C6|nr:amidase family protein [Paenibacillus daejeonensis]